MTSVRAAAVRVLVALERGHTTLADELEQARGELAVRRDRGLLLEITAGTLRWQRALDAILEGPSRRPLADLDPVVRALVRVGAYQLHHLDRVPAHAVVNESVEAIRELGYQRAAGFVNAVLRTVARARQQPVLPARPASADDRAAWVAYLGVTLSHPAWLVERWLDRHGPDAVELWCRFNNTPPRVTLRVHHGVDRADMIEQLSRVGIGAEAAAFGPDALSITPGSATQIPGEIWAQVSIQDEGSQLVGHVAASVQSDIGAESGPARVLDLCASPGGKTMILAADGAATSQIVASDNRPARVALLRDTLRRANLEIPVVRLDAAAALPFGPAFDLVLLDAPCSGLGTLRRDPDLKWSRRAEDLTRLMDSEAQMLRRAASVVRVGGAVVYATCSNEPEENEAVVAGFLDGRPDFSLERAVPPAGVEVGVPLIDAQGCLRTLPFAHGLDAFFAAVLRHRGPA